MGIPEDLIFCADDKFIECILAERLDVAVPKSVILPNKSYEADIVPDSLRNLQYPMPWEEIAEYVGLTPWFAPSSATVYARPLPSEDHTGSP